MKHPRVLHWDDERKLGNSLIITTVKGWAFVPNEDENIAQHVEGFDTVKEARKALAKARPCSCAWCRSEGRE